MTIRDANDRLHAANGQFAEDKKAEPAGASDVLKTPLSSSDLRNEQVPASERVESLSKYLGQNGALNRFQDEYLGLDGPSASEMFEQIAMDEAGAPVVLAAAAETMDTESGAVESDRAYAVAEEAYGAWQEHAVAVFRQGFRELQGGSTMSESEIWDVYGDRPGKRDALLAAGGHVLPSI